jgi:hypothetical protein
MPGVAGGSEEEVGHGGREGNVDDEPGRLTCGVHASSAFACLAFCFLGVFASLAFCGSHVFALSGSFAGPAHCVARADSSSPGKEIQTSWIGVLADFAPYSC